MTITTLTSRQFNQDASKAKKAAKTGPVFITDRGRLAHVLLSIEAYQELTSSGSASIIDMLAMPGIRHSPGLAGRPRPAGVCRPSAGR